MNMLARHDNWKKEWSNFNSMMDLFMREFNSRDPELWKMGDPGSRLQLQTEEKEVKAILPCAGCKGSDFEVDVVGDMLNIKVKHSSGSGKEEKKEKKYIAKERYFCEFTESCRLPVPVKGQEASAKYEDGVLTITIPRLEPELPKIHTVTVK